MTAEDSNRSLINHFRHLEDPRDGTKARHQLLDIIAIAVAAVICGADDWVSIAAFAWAKEAWLRQFLDLPNGIPSHDTFGRGFSLLVPQAFEECFRAWVNTVRQAIPEEVVAIDGKSVRRSHNWGAGLGALHMVIAWATANRVVLGQVATEAKSNEITAIPRLLDFLMVKGCIVTIDTMGCQTKSAVQIIVAGGDDVLALKVNQGNQGTLAEEVEVAFIDADAKAYTGLNTQVIETSERDHGRVETRRYETPWASSMASPGARCGRVLNMIGMVELQRELEGKTSTEYRFYIASIGTDAKCFARAVRGHWGIENDLHWSFDGAFCEDDSRLRDPQVRENFAVLRHIALTHLKNDTREKMGIKNKRLKAGWDDKYLSDLLFKFG